MDMNQVKHIYLTLGTALGITVDAPTPTPPAAPVDDDLVGPQKISRLYGELWALWHEAQRLGWPMKDGSKFTIFKWIPGLQPGTTPGGPAKVVDWLEVNNVIRELALSPKGQEWLSSNENLAVIDNRAAIQFTGFYVTRKPDGTLERHNG